jgi:hypothetical protein
MNIIDTSLFFQNYYKALMFSLYDTMITYGRGVDDDFNIIPAGALACATYSIPNGIKSVAKGGLFGSAIALAYLSFMNSESLFSKISFNSSNDEKTKY